MRVRPMFAWYDAWIGVFIDRPKRRVYVFPIPCVGLRIDLGPVTQPAAAPCAEETPAG